MHVRLMHDALAAISGGGFQANRLLSAQMRFLKWFLLVAALLALFATPAVAQSTEDDAETFEVEDDDLVADDFEEEDMIVTVLPYEIPMEGVVSTVFFPGSPADRKFTLGDEVVVLMTVFNRGTTTYNITGASISLLSPHDRSMHVYNVRCCEM